MYCANCIYNYRGVGGFCCSLKDIDTEVVRVCRDRQTERDDEDYYCDDDDYEKPNDEYYYC